MRRIAIVVGVCGLLAACGQEAQVPGPGRAPGQQLDYIDAVPISEDEPAPVAQPESAPKKEEPEAGGEKAEKAEAEAAPAPAATPTPPPAAPSNDAATATRRANEAVAPRSETEVPYSPN